MNKTTRKLTVKEDNHLNTMFGSYIRIFSAHDCSIAFLVFKGTTGRTSHAFKAVTVHFKWRKSIGNKSNIPSRLFVQYVLLDHFEADWLGFVNRFDFRHRNIIETLRSEQMVERRTFSASASTQECSNSTNY